jgi:transposase
MRLGTARLKPCPFTTLFLKQALTNAQLELLEREPGVSHVAVQAESEREPLPSTPAKRKHPGRQTLPPDLPRVERVIACTSEQCVCGNCGGERTVIGDEQSAQLEVEPAKYLVLVTKREKRAGKQCEAGGVVSAPLPPRIIEKSLVRDRVIVASVVRKYADHNPLYRQRVMLNRDASIDVSRATRDGWVMRVGELLAPVVAVMRRELIAGHYIQADETPVEVGGACVVRAACWAHSRRQFVEAVRLNPSDTMAARAVALIDALFAIAAKARQQPMDHATRHALRQQKAPAWLEPNPAADRKLPARGAARQHAGQGVSRHPCFVDEADAIPRTSRVGAIQQPGGERDATDRGGSS